MMEAVLIRSGMPTFREQAETHQGESTTETVTPAAVRQQVERILASRAFVRSPRISRFLEFVVDQTLNGLEDKLKEYLLGVEVFNRQESFDPRIDSIVRVEARRLRFKLDKYYETEGADDLVHIQFRKGCYVPSFHFKASPAQPDGNALNFPYLDTIDNHHAFSLWARGMQHSARWTADGIAEAISCFSQAVAEDPGCVPAHAALGSSWLLASLLGIMPGRDAVAKARKCAAEAIRLKPESSEAHAVLAACSALHDFEWNEAELQIRRTIPLNPCDRKARLWYGLCALLAGRTEEAQTELRKVQQSDPASLTAHLACGFAMHLAQAHDDALQQYRLAQELNPGSYAPHLVVGLLLSEKQMHEQAHQALSQASQLSPLNPNVMAISIYGHSAAGRSEAAAQVASELEQLAARQYVPPLSLAIAHALNGDMDQAIEKLEAAYDERSPWLALVRLLPAFAKLRNDDRYPALVARIGLA